MISLVTASVITLIVIYDTLRLGISPYPTTRSVRDALLNAIPALPEGKIYELGSGWGGLAHALARQFPHRPVVAFEAALIPYLFSRVYQWLFPCKNLRIYRRDFFRESLQGAALICCYLYPGAMKRLSSKFSSELRLGSIVISHTFALPEHQSHITHPAPNSARTPIYVYQIK
jgi:hypothetical protein